MTALQLLCTKRELFRVEGLSSPTEKTEADAGGVLASRESAHCASDENQVSGNNKDSRTKQHALLHVTSIDAGSIRSESTDPKPRRIKEMGKKTEQSLSDSPPAL
jgi:hypothetical protein